MRREIQTAPKDGKLVILEDDAAGTFELGRWSTKESAWVGKDGKPIAITPAHWLPLQHDPWLENEEHLPQKEPEHCGQSDHPEIQPILPLAQRAALEYPPARETVVTQKNDHVPVIVPPTAASQPGPPAWNCLAQGNEHPSQTVSESCDGLDPRIQPIIPSSARAALEWLAQKELSAPRKEATLPIIEPRIATIQPGPPAWSCLAQSDEHPPQREAESRDLPDPNIQPIFPFASARAALELPAKEDVFTPKQNFSFPVIEPRPVAKQPRSPAWRRYAIFPITAMIVLSLIVMYFRAPVAAYVTRHNDPRDAERVDRIGQQPSQNATSLPIQWLADLLLRAPTVQQRAMSGGSSARTVSRDAVHMTMASQAPKFLEKELRLSNDVVNEPVELEPSLDGRELQLQDGSATASQSQRPDGENTTALRQDLAATRERLTENEVRYGKALAEERDRNSALASELATAKRIVETQALQWNKTASESAQLKLVADAAASKLQRERERAEALATELEKMRRQVEAAAVDEIQRAPEIATAELQQSDAVMLPSAPRNAHAPQSVSWSVYRGKGGAVVDVPLGIFVQDAGPTAKGIGRRLKSADGRSEFAVYSFREPGQTPGSYLRNNLAVDPATISYKRVTNRFFALSSESGGRIYYSRCNFYDAIHCIYLAYPQSEKVAWDAIVTRISRTLRRGS